MKTFFVRFLSSDGNYAWTKRKGINVSDVRNIMFEEGLNPSIIIPDFINAMDKTKNGGMKDKFLIIFFRDLANLVQSTGSLSKSVNFLYNRSPQNTLKVKANPGVLDNIVIRYYKDKYKNRDAFLLAAIKDIDTGYMFSKTLVDFEFDELAVNLVKVSESTGDAAVIFKKISNYFEIKTAYKNSFVSALSYPLFLMSLIFATFTVFIFYVIPAFSSFFKNFKHIPKKTLFTLNLFANIKEFYFIYLGTAVFIAGILVYLWLSNFKMIREKVFKKLADIPVAGHFFKFNFLRWYFYQFSVLISAGHTYTGILEYFKNITKNEYFKAKFDLIYSNLVAGKMLNESFSAAEILRPEDLDSIYTAEVSGTLDETMMTLSEAYRALSDMEIKVITKVLNGLVVAIVVFFILFIFLSVYLPMIMGVVSLPGNS